MLSGLCALRMDGSTIVEVLGKGMDSDDLDDFMDEYGAEAQEDIFLYYFGDGEDGSKMCIRDRHLFIAEVQPIQIFSTSAFPKEGQIFSPKFSFFKI